MSQQSGVIALLPFKLESVRVPNKNFRSVQGVKLYEIMLNKLLSIKVISKIVINTDAAQKIDPKYFEVDRIVIRDRNKELLGNDTSMNLVIESDVLYCDQNFEEDIFLMTHVTNPLLEVSTIREALDLYLKNRVVNDSLFSVNQFYSRFYDNSLSPVNHNPKVLMKTQDLKPLYEENSCFYIFSRESFLSEKHRIGKNPNIYVLDKIEALDIDDESDWAQLEILTSPKCVNVTP